MSGRHKTSGKVSAEVAPCDLFLIPFQGAASKLSLRRSRSCARQHGRCPPGTHGSEALTLQRSLRGLSKTPYNAGKDF